MKKILILSIIMFSVSLHGATKIDRTRGHIWARVSFSGTLTDSGLGVFAMVSSRYNFHARGEIVTTTSTVSLNTADGAWNQQAWIGPQWKFSRKNFQFITKPLYLFYTFFADEKAETPGGAAKLRYYRHAVDWMNDFSWKFKNLRLFYRLRMVNDFPGETGNGDELDYELINRNAFGVVVPVHKYISLFFMEEVFLKLTASDRDNDGTEFFDKNALWGGVHFKIFRGMSFRLNYGFFYINKMDTPVKEMKILDHYICMHLHYNLDFTSL